MEVKVTNPVVHLERDNNQVSEAVKKKGFALLIYDIKQRELIPIKILFFVVLSSIGVLLPFMTVHMKSLGINVAETAVINAVSQFSTIAAPPVIGMIADKLDNFKVLLSVVLVLAGANALLFLVIPTGRFIDTYPSNLSFALGYDGNYLTLSHLDSKSCEIATKLVYDAYDVPFLLTSGCGYVCYDNPRIFGGMVGPKDSAPEWLPANWPDLDQSYKKYRHALFISEPWSLNVSCVPEEGEIEEETICGISMASLEHSDKKPRLTNMQVYGLKYAIQNTYPISHTKWNDGPSVYLVRFEGLYDKPFKLVRPLTFRLNNTLKSDQGSLMTDKDVAAESDVGIVYKTCRRQCVLTAPRESLCTNKAHEVEFDPQLTFWIYLLMRATFGLLLGGAMVLFESAGSAVVMQYKGDLGLQRMFGVLGIMIFSPVSGALIDHFSIGRDIPDYRPAFYLYALLVGFAAIGIHMIDLDFKPPAKELLKDIWSLLKNLELDVFFVTVLMSGLYCGFIESYLFWLLEEMGGNKLLMGLTKSISSLFGIPALLLSDWIFRKIGHPLVQVIGFVVYAIRLIGYSYMYDPYMCLIYEMMEAVTTSLMTTSAIVYSAQLVPTTTTLVSTSGLIGGAYYGVGRGMGSLVGGFMMRSLSPDPLTSLDVGTRLTFRYLGIAAVLTAVPYFFFDVFFIKPKHKKGDKNASVPADAPVAAKSGDTAEHGGGQINPVYMPDHSDETQNIAVNSTD